MMVQQDNGDLVFYASKIRIVLIAVFCGVPLFSIGVWMLMTGQDGKIQFMGLIGTLFFGACIVASIMMLFRKKPTLTITRNAIVFHPGVFQKTGTEIALNDIERVEIASISSNKMACIHVRDPDRYVARMSTAAAAAARFNLKRGYGIAAVNRPQIGHPQDDFIKLVMTSVEAARAQAL